MKKYLLPLAILVLVLLLISACGRKDPGKESEPSVNPTEQSSESVVDPADPGEGTDPADPAETNDEPSVDPAPEDGENTDSDEGELVIGDEFVVPVGDDEGTGNL